MAQKNVHAICRPTERSVLYANELLQCDCHRSPYSYIVLGRHTGDVSVPARRQLRDAITTPTTNKCHRDKQCEIRTSQLLEAISLRRTTGSKLTTKRLLLR